MAGEVYLVVQTLAAMAFFGLALLLVVLRFKSRINRSFAFVVFLLGMGILLQVLEHLATDAGARWWVAYWTIMILHVRLGLGPAILYFAVSYLQVKPIWSGLGRAMAIFGGAGLQIWFALDHCAYQCVANGTVSTGPLLLVVSVVPAYMAATGIFMLQEAGNAHRARTTAARLMALAFLLYAAFDGAVFWGRILFDPRALLPFHGQIWPLIAEGALALAFITACVGLILLMTAPQPLASRVRLASFAAGAVLSGLFVAALLTVYHIEDSWEQLVVGSWRTALPTLVVYALLRHHLFGMDVKVRHGVARGTIVLVFLAIFFSVSKMAEFYVSGWGYLGGSVAAGLLILALRPLEKFGDRIGDLLVKPKGHTEKMPEALRLQMYEDMVRTIWEDGVMDRKERILLDDLRKRLSLDAERASQVERQAVSERMAGPALIS